ncbi:MAG: transposase [Enterococcus italicus]|nr:transposase [Enterococcus italicus]
MIAKISSKVRVSIDLFHIIQQINRALHTQRIKTVKSLNRNDSKEMKE